jgi:transcriptional regulator with XRE-family HTH domain
LRAWRARHRKRIDDIAKDLGTCRSHVSRIETGGVKKIGVELAMRIAAMIGADLEAYLGTPTGKQEE